MIPKRIFYVWGANEPLKAEAEKYISGWKKYMPDYEIIQLDENAKEYFSYDEALKNDWFKTVYNKKMWAYVADYIRLKVLYDYGGIYLDTDVEVLKDFGEFLDEPAFVGIQESSIDGKHDLVEPAILGSKKGNPFLKKAISFYDSLIWTEPIYTMPQIFGYYLKEYSVEKFPPKHKQEIIKTKDITIYPEEYFIPYRYETEFNSSCVTKNTVTIHHWGGSWVKPAITNFLIYKHRLPMLRKRVLK